VSNVRLRIGGREFAVACASGEEDHVALLGREIDDKLRAAGGVVGQSETRMLLLAALLLADELHEARAGSPPPPPDRTADVERLCSGIEAAAGRIEKLAAHLEQAAAGA
jgi:cell division protein ZapA